MFVAGHCDPAKLYCLYRVWEQKRTRRPPGTKADLLYSAEAGFPVRLRATPSHKAIRWNQRSQRKTAPLIYP